MIRVVLDTNVVLSSLLQPLGPPAKVLHLARRGLIRLCVSGPVYSEYEEVLQRPRFSGIAASIDPMLQFLRERGLWVRPEERLLVCRDPDDNIFLECARQAAASWLVTGNTADFPSQWRETAIVRPREFLDRLI
jgi:putative PIN family toxin of toxin-antitoxin system